jgi:hypothetical protein
MCELRKRIFDLDWGISVLAKYIPGGLHVTAVA